MAQSKRSLSSSALSLLDQTRCRPNPHVQPVEKLLLGCCLPCSLSAQDLRYLKYTFRVFVYIYVCVCVSLSLSLSLVPFCVWETLKFYTVLMCSNLYGIAYNWNAISDSLLGTNNPFQNDNFALSEPHSISN